MRLATDVFCSAGVGEGAEGMLVTVTGEVRTAGGGETRTACWCCVGVPFLEPEPGLWPVRVLCPSTNGLARANGFLSAMPPLSGIAAAGSGRGSLKKEARPVLTMGEERSPGPGPFEGLSPGGPDRELAVGLPSSSLSTVA